jgi:hypothetical protein
MSTHTITITKFKHYPALSEETIAFTCDVLMDGKKIGHAKNEGHGGETVFYGSEPMGFDERSKIADIVDGFVAAEIMDKQKEKDKKAVAKKLNNGLFFRIKGQKSGAYFSINTKLTKDANIREKVKEQAKKRGEEIELFINDLPVNEAVKFFYRYE